MSLLSLKYEEKNINAIIYILIIFIVIVIVIIIVSP